MIKKLAVPLCEDDLKKYWIYTDKVYISCCCITFNQKDYIRDAIDSFLAQETEYRFEIIIHDDVSTDGTRDILLEYKNKYPSIIKLILQDNNQYSQGNKVTPIAVKHAEGEYIALCEGDDFWIDKYKLQKQIVELENNKDINICFTAAYGLDPQNKMSKLCDYKKNNIFKFDDVILGGGSFMPTASLMIRKKIFNNLPDWFFTHAPVGDYFIQVLASENGAIYICKYSTVYRINAVGSWSSKSYTESDTSIIKKLDRWVFCLNKLKDKYGNRDVIDKVISQSYLNDSYQLLKNSNISESKKLLKKSWEGYRFLSIKQIFLKILLLLK